MSCEEDRLACAEDDATCGSTCEVVGEVTCGASEMIIECQTFKNQEKKSSHRTRQGTSLQARDFKWSSYMLLKNNTLNSIKLSKTSLR